MTKTIDALIEALEYWLPKAEPLPNTYDKVCEHHKNQWKKAVAALAQARAEQAEMVTEGTLGARLSDHVSVPRELLAAACSAIDKKRDAPKTLAQIRRYTMGDLSVYTTPPAAPVAKLEPLSDNEVERIHQDSYNDTTGRKHSLIFARALEAAHNAKLGAA